MNITSGIFLFFLFIVIACQTISNSRAWREAVLLTASAIFLYTYAPHKELVEALPLFLFSFVGYGFSWCLAVNHRKKFLLPFSCAIVIAIFTYMKGYSIIPSKLMLENPILSVGASYILFRIIQVMVDISEGFLTFNFRISTYFLYLFYFPSFLSGPIQRFQDFDDQMSSPKPLTKNSVSSSIARASDGFILALVIAPFTFYLFETFKAMLEIGEGGGALMKRFPLWLMQIFTNPSGDNFLRHLVIYSLMSVLYTLFLYFNFAGYMGIVISASRLMGYTIPENFNKPILSSNFLDFWSRWHITLAEWFKTYVFTPLTQTLLTRHPNKSFAPFIFVLSLLVTFLTMGIWHGTTFWFFVYGLFLGIGVSINRLYQLIATKYFGKIGYANLKSRVLYSFSCRTLTFTYFCIALMTWWVGTDFEWNYLLKKLAILGCLFLFIFIFGLVSAFLTIHHFGSKLIGNLSNLIELRIPLMRNSSFLSAFKIVVVIYAIFLTNTKVPDFIYKGF